MYSAAGATPTQPSMHVSCMLALRMLGGERPAALRSACRLAGRWRRRRLSGPLNDTGSFKCRGETLSRPRAIRSQHFVHLPTSPCVHMGRVYCLLGTSNITPALSAPARAQPAARPLPRSCSHCHHSRSLCWEGLRPARPTLPRPKPHTHTHSLREPRGPGACPYKQRANRAKRASQDSHGRHAIMQPLNPLGTGTGPAAAPRRGAARPLQMQRT